MEWIPEIYRESRFWLFPMATSAISMLAFVLFAFPLTLLAYLDPPSLRKFRVQPRRPSDPKRMIRAGIGHWVANNAIMTCLVVAAWPVLRLAPVRMDDPSAWYVCMAQIGFFVFFDDFLYYWMHRAFHQGILYRKIHRVHHTVVTPWAVTAHHMHAVEFVATGTLALLGPVLLGVHIYTLWIWIAFRQWEAAEGHCGYSFPWSPSKLIFRPFYDGVEYHDFHHSKFHGNYAGFLSYMDKIFGEYSRGYLQAVGRQSSSPEQPEGSDSDDRTGA